MKAAIQGSGSTPSHAAPGTKVSNAQEEGVAKLPNQNSTMSTGCCGAPYQTCRYLGPDQTWSSSQPLNRTEQGQEQNKTKT
jgi:hypothetical protein